MAGCRAPALQVCIPGGWWWIPDGWWCIPDGWWCIPDGWRCIPGGWWCIPGGWWCILASSAAYCSRAPRQGHALTPQCGGALP